MPTYDYNCPNCGIFEEYHSISIKLSHCPTCEKNGITSEVNRLISGGSGKGIVELTGDDLVKKIKSDANQLNKDAQKSEKTYANLLGEDKYQSLQTRMDKQRR